MASQLAIQGSRSHIV